MQKYLAAICLLLSQCTTPEPYSQIISIQLQESALASRKRTDGVFLCIKTSVDRDTLKANKGFIDLYERLNRILKVRDSLTQAIHSTFDSRQSIKILEKLKVEIVDAHHPKFRPDEFLESNFNIELNLIKEEFDRLSPDVKNDLLKCIIERWTDEGFDSFMRHVVIDGPC